MNVALIEYTKTHSLNLSFPAELSTNLGARGSSRVWVMQVCYFIFVDFFVRDSKGLVVRASCKRASEQDWRSSAMHNISKTCVYVCDVLYL